MKRILLFLLLANVQMAFSQTMKYKTTFETVTVVEERTINLNGGARGTIGKSYGAASRVTIPVILPANTVEWYYSFSTNKSGNSFSQNLKLALQIASAVAEKTTTAGKVISFTGLDDAVINSIRIPEGSMPVNTYILDASNSARFLEKMEFTPQYGFNAERMKHGAVKVRYPVNGTFYLGVQNLSTLSAVDVKLEVVAVVRKTEVVYE